MAAATVPALILVIYFVSHQHASYYMGDDATTVNCIPCHIDAEGGGLLDRIAPPQYASPRKPAIAPDGSKLYLVAEESGSLLVVDLPERRVTGVVRLQDRPHDVVLDRSGVTAYVSNSWSDTVSVVDLASLRVSGSLETGNIPSGLALDRAEEFLYVANWQSHSISILDLATGAELRRLAGGSNPNLMALTPDGKRLLVTNELSNLAPVGTVPISEVTLIDTESQQVVRRFEFPNSHLLEDIVVLPEGDLAVFALVRPKNLLPILHVLRGWVMTNGLGIIDLRTGERAQLLLDEPDRYFADPYGVAATPDGRYLFVSHGGVDQVSVVDVARLREAFRQAILPGGEDFANRLDLSAGYVVKRIATGANPQGMVVSPDGALLYVAERLDDSILAVDIESLRPAFRIDLTNIGRETPIRRGEKLFNSASRTFQEQFSCRSCHPRNHVDRLQYDFESDGPGRNILDNRTLLGIRNTAPFKWNGRNTSLFMQCGIRFARILTRVEPFPPTELAAMVAFIRSLEVPPNPHRLPDGGLTPSQERGKHFFERSVTRDGEPITPLDRCVTCHPPPLFTNRKSADVGSASPTDTITAFDTPHLLNIYNSAPYLHDGKARTLEEIWTIYNPDDTHGVTRDMSQKDLNDLIEYLKSL
jgi:YVTN family beta-propeller protein